MTYLASLDASFAASRRVFSPLASLSILSDPCGVASGLRLASDENPSPIRSRIFRTRHLALLVPALLVLAACGSKPKESAVDKAPFRAALEDHMARNKWEVKIDEIESIDVQGESATAVVRVTHKESTGLKPKWTVKYVQKDGKWTVEDVKR